MHFPARPLAALCGALLLTAPSAGAHSGHTFSHTVGPSSMTVTMTTGASEIDTLTIDFEAGWRFAHADGYGNELMSNPNDDEQIGSGSMTAAWVVLFCATSTQSLTVWWEEDMTGAPGGAVAHYRMTNTLSTTHIWVIEENDATDDYKLTIDLDAGLTCSSQPSTSSFSLTLNQYAHSGGQVYAPPTASGCYTTAVTFNDVSGGVHTGSADVPIGSGSC